MKNFACCLLVIMLGVFSQAKTQNIVAAEYFIDADPGAGNGTSTAIPTGANILFNISVPTVALPVGFHLFGIRVKNAAGNWSLFTTQGFYISQPLQPASNVIAAEYFFDADPGIGSGTSIAITPGATSTFNAIIPTQSLATGFHLVAIRIKNAAGRWSLFESQGFFISPPSLLASNIVSAEYFFDTDPGFGSATAINILSATQYKDSLLLPLGALPLGNHTIALRVKDASGKWSLLESRPFNVCANYGPLSKMSLQTEYNTVFFTNNSSYADSTEWQFGDNTFDTGINPIKTYSVPGNYTVKLISKNLCAKDTFTFVVNINGIQRINAPGAGNAGVATIVFDGNGFTPNTELKLLKDAAILLPTSKVLISPNRIVGYFNLFGADTGNYHAIADLGGGSLDTLKNAMHISPAVEPLVSLYFNGGRYPQRFGSVFKYANLQNEGNEDAIMVPFAMAIGYKPEISGPRLALPEVPLDLTDKGIFQETYQYLNTNGISTGVMNNIDLDTVRKRQLMAFYQLRVPAETRTSHYIRVYNNYDLLAFTSGARVFPAMFGSGIVAGNLGSPYRDCMNSFLKKAVKKNITVTINTNEWNNCFNSAFDQLAQTIKTLSQDLTLQNAVIPMKAVYASLLTQMSKCGSSGMPIAINSATFENIVRDVTNNWIFLENIDSIGRPCFDTTETLKFSSEFSNIQSLQNKVKGQITLSDDCPGAKLFPELAELCAPFLEVCGFGDNLGQLDNAIVVATGKKIFEKLTDGLDKACKVNSASVSCEKFCEQTSVDPNAKSGPGDNNISKYVNNIKNTGYAIFFENIASATAPAAYVEINDTIDKTKFDLASFQAGGFGWGDSIVNVEANRTNYSLLKDIRPAHQNKLRVDIKLDTAAGIVTWKFYTLDLATLELTDDPSQGFLPPNTDGVKGVGYDLS